MDRRLWRSPSSVSPWYFMSTAEKHITSSLTSLLICCVPLFSVVAQRIRRTEEHITARRYLGLAVGAAGVALLVGLDVRSGSLTWVGFMLIVALGYTVGPIILATKLNHVPGIAVVAGATAFVALCWIPWSIVHWPARISAETWSSVAVLSVVCTAGAFLVFFELIKEVGATRSVVVTYFNTAIAVVLGIIVLQRAPDRRDHRRLPAGAGRQRLRHAAVHPGAAARSPLGRTTRRTRPRPPPCRRPAARGAGRAGEGHVVDRSPQVRDASPRLARPAC